MPLLHHGCLISLLTGLISQILPHEGQIPDTVKFSFYAGGVVLLISVLYTVFSTKEYSPEELKSFEECCQREYNTDDTESVAPTSTYVRRGIIWTLVGIVFALPIIFS